MSKIEFRNQCMKVTTLIAVIILGIFDVAWVGYLLYSDNYKNIKFSLFYY